MEEPAIAIQGAEHFDKVLLAPGGKKWKRPCMEPEEIIAALNRNLENEYGSVLFYIQFSSQPAISREPKLSKVISGLAADEMRHAEYLADQIALMGGKSSWQVAPFERKNTLKENLELIIEIEEEAIREYTELIEKLDDRPAIQNALREILEDEKAHRAKTEKILRTRSKLLSKG